MSDVLLYWRDYSPEWRKRAGEPRAWFWHSSSKAVADLRPGDRMWMITSGRAVRHEPTNGGFLLGMWNVREVVDNPDDEPDYPAAEYRKRVVADPSGSVMLGDPVAVDQILRPAGRDAEVSIGRYLQGPRKLSDEKVRLLRNAAGGELATAWLRRSPPH